MISRELINTIEEKHLKNFLKIQRLSDIFEEDNSTTLCDFILKELSENDIFKYDFNNFLNDYFQIVNNTRLYVYPLNYQDINKISKFVSSHSDLLKVDFHFSKGFSNEKISVINSHHEFIEGKIVKSTINLFLKNVQINSKKICLTTTAILNYKEGYAAFAFPYRIITNHFIDTKKEIYSVRTFLLNLFENEKSELFSITAYKDINFLKNGLYKLYNKISKPIENELISSLPEKINDKISDLLKSINLEDDINQSKLIKNALYQSLGDRDFQQNIKNYKNGWIFWLSFSDKMGTNVNTRDKSYNPIYMTDVFWNIREYIKNTINEIGYNYPIKKNEQIYTSKVNYSTFHKALEINLYTIRFTFNEDSSKTSVVSDYKKIIELREEEFKDVESKIKTIL